MNGKASAQLDDRLRDILYRAVYEEFVGPIDFSSREYLKRPPSDHYSAGVLHPRGTSFQEYEDREGEGLATNDAALPPLKVGNVPQGISHGSSDDDAADEEPISMSNARKQSAISMTVALRAGDSITLHARAATYALETQGDERVYARHPMEFELTNETVTIPRAKGAPVRVPLDGKGLELWLVFRRSIPESDVITIALCNISTGSDKTENCYYQASFDISSALGLMPPTWAGPSQTPLTVEEEGKQLIYRNIRNYAVGHGCATRWDKGDTVKFAETQTMPWAETHPMKTLHPSLEGLVLSLEAFSKPENWTETRNAISALCVKYQEWIGSLEEKASALRQEYMPAANRNITECKRCLKRIQSGLELLDRNHVVRNAFILMNEVMYDQYIHYSVVSGERSSIDEKPKHPRSWRPFQLAFIVMNIKSMVDNDCSERVIVDLIWFPTGGGKTEAYLGLSAFILIFERLIGSCSDGVTVVMRYTLRLLTSQQFDRASSLICALESKRRKMPEVLGSREFRIGLWVGDAASPNKREDATRLLTEYRDRNGDKNPFPVRCCPWCGADMEANKRKAYRRVGRNARIGFFCPNEACEYSEGDGLPLDVVDEEIYDRPPSLMVGTVDKFAMLPYRSEALKLFGIKNGDFGLPPKLIIQDELHLISGPLGSMAAHYETLISDLCTRESELGVVSPKIIASTATVSRAKEQCNQLYACGEDNVFQFPPSGIDYDDSFFSMEDPEGRGRRYVGLFVPDLSASTTSIRLYSDLIWEPVTWEDVPDEWVDRYWTTIGYYGTTRELGQAVTWMGGDIPERLREHRRKARDEGKGYSRFIRVGKELTGRKDADEVKAGLDSLKISYPDENAVDLCFATNMISVGLDVGRLGIMVVAGQPKSTAEYIQATSRVGRSEAKGVVFVVYNPTKPRDRSHYENFAMFHESFYQQVEPSSVTAFCQQVRERALFGTLVGMYRSITDPIVVDAFKAPDAEAFEYASSVLRERVSKVDPEELDGLEDDLIDIRERWEKSDFQRWDELRPEGMLAATPLMHPWGGETLDTWGGSTFDVPTSLRSVDKECRLAIVGSYGGYGSRNERGQNG